MVLETQVRLQIQNPQRNISLDHEEIIGIPKAAKLVNCSTITEEYISAGLVNE
ncbi:hypothetical protein LINPERPRIM_LOCUS13665 [Linum perenne]